MADEKQRLRKILEQTRASLSPARACELSDCIQQRLVGLSCFIQAPAVALYSAKDGEVITDTIFSIALAAAKRVYFPRLDRSLNTLSLVPVAERSALKPGAFGILEPQGPELGDLTALKQGLVCVPGVAFAQGGIRLGRGGGHYDRLLAELGTTATTIGLAYSFQFLSHLPEGAEDHRVDMVVTEFSVHRGKRANLLPR
jgi:5-formyltetrahydrofolate cyclo-ligase